MNLRIVCCAAAVILAGFVASASAGEISKSTLKSMGLGGMQQLSDSDGLAVRGKGTSASVWGQGTANFFGGTTSTNGYAAAADHHHSSSFAAGGNISVAGVVGGVGGSGGFVVGGIVAVAGGASFAYAK